MTDRPGEDTPFDRALRGALADLAPDNAPPALRVAVAGVPHRRRQRSATPTRWLMAAAGIAAAVVVATAGLAILAGSQHPVGGPVPVATPSSAASAPGMTTLTFRVVTPDGSMSSKAQIQAVDDVMSARLRAYGIGTFSSSASDDWISIEIPPGAAARDVLNSLLGATGVFTVGQPVVEPPAELDHVTGPPLLTADAITDARVGVDQTGRPTLDLTLSRPAAATLADATSAHIGEYMVMALDGVAISVPVIQSAIANGQVQIQFPSDDETTPMRLAAILQAGPLPLPVEPVAP